MRVEQLGKYQLIQHLASGGMASVYLARVSGPGGFERHVVLKTLRTQGLVDPSLVPMFLDEARLAASLHHQHIAQVFDVGSEDGTYYLAMEYVHGETLRLVMEAALATDRTLPLGFGVTVLCAAAAGLHHAHERCGPGGAPLGIVHRDVTPSNLIVSYDGSIKLIDFGIAKATEQATHTRTGFIKGKVGYMAPEQIRGYPVDRRTDVFALGVLAYEVLTLRRAFAGNSQFDSLERTVHSDLALPTKVVPGFPPELEDVIMTALEIDPDDRYSNADQMRRDLARVAERLDLPIGEPVVLAVLDTLFGSRPEPWMGSAAPGRGVSEQSGARSVPLVARPELDLARGTGETDAIDDDDESTTVPGGRTSEDMVTNRVETIEPVAIALPLPAPQLETPVPVEAPFAEPVAAPPVTPSLPVARPRARGWAWALVVGTLLAAATFLSIVRIFAPAEHAAVPRVSTEPSAPPRASTPVPVRRSAPAVAPATEITLHVTTEPVGATVVLDGVRLGTTPFTAKLPVRSKPAWLKVRRRGSIPTKTQVSLERDVTWSVQLRALH
ncbi:hypothetical protein BH11MYX3_BH11MYX3_31090 [soil metagenome]